MTQSRASSTGDPSPWYSLRFRLPLLTSLLIAGVLTTFLAVAYIQVERSLLQVGNARAQAASDQLATLLAQSAQQRLTDLQRAANNAAVRNYLRDPASDATDARQRLSSLATAGQPAVELWTAAGERVLSVAGRPAAAGAVPAAQVPALTAPLLPGISEFHVAQGVVYWDAVVVVVPEMPATAGTPPPALGSLASRRILAGGSSSDVLNRLVGSGAAIKIGNQSGGPWTDLSKVVAAPPVDVRRDGLAQYRSADGEDRLGANTKIRGTPWTVWVEFPRRLVVAPARAFLLRMLLVALVFIAASAFIAGLVGARITIPLHRLTGAAESIAAGQFGEAVDASRRDEIGRLGAAFNTMARQVQDVQHDLEDRVRQRTARLEEASGLLAERLAELHETRQEIDRFFTISLDMLCIAGIDGYFKRLNPAWTETLGWTDEELRARPSIDFVHPDDRAETISRAARLAEGPAVVTLENRYAHRDGSYRWLQWRSIRVADRDAIYATARDVTDQKAAESRILTLNDQLEQRVVELRNLTHELEAFTYSVSHDLRAPLRHVTGFASLLEKSAGAALDDQGRRYLQTISEAATRMGRLIDDLLAFSRMSRAEMLRGPVDLAALVEDARRETLPALEGRHVTWKIHPLPVVRGDAAMLRLALTNLLSNAIKYTAPQPSAQIEIGCRETPHELTVFVRDNGVGFDMAHADKLFGVFQRLHDADEFGGTGIGLANVRRIIHRHGGRTWAEGRVNEGATFFFSLPSGSRVEANAVNS
jgi:PAS domain S-box-containing protein